MPAARSPTCRRRLKLLRRHLVSADTDNRPTGLAKQLHAPDGRSQGGEEDQRQPVCVVIGAGSGVGQGVARAFAAEGHHVVCVRRSDEAKLEALAADIREKLGEATAMKVDCTEEESVKQMMEDIERDIGPIHVAVCNIGAAMGNLPLSKLSVRVFERAWRMGSLSAFLMAKYAVPGMERRGHGTLLFTSASGAVRGNAAQMATASALSGRRRVAESLAAELAPKGIHVAHCMIDGLIDSPDTAGKFFPKAFAQMKAERDPKDGLVKGSSVGEAYVFVHKQPRNAWTFDLDLRPWYDKIWFHN